MHPDLSQTRRHRHRRVESANPTTQFAEFSGPAAIGAHVGITSGEENALPSQRLVLGALSSDTSTLQSD
jgi:hypothetical protein